MLTANTKFLGFKPTDGFQLYADSLLGRLLSIAPSDASVSSSFEKREGRFSCRIEIISAVERFEAVIESLHPRSALEEARRRILRQIVRWRRRRFAPG